MVPSSNISNTGVKAANKIQKVMRGHNARKDLRNEILNKASNERQAATNIQNAFRSRNARHELATNQQNFNPIDYQDRLRANKKTFQNKISDYTDRRPQPLTKKQSKRLEKAEKGLNAINELTTKRKQTGRPPAGEISSTSRLSGTASRLSTASTLPPSSPGAAFTPKKK